MGVLLCANPTPTAKPPNTDPSWEEAWGESSLANGLFSIFLKFLPHYCIRRGTEIEVSGQGANTRCEV